MYTDILRRIAGIEVFPVVSLLLFVAVFTAVLIWTVRLDAARIALLAQLPLDPPPSGGTTAGEIAGPSTSRSLS